MEGCENPFMCSLVRILAVEDHGEAVVLAYRSPKRLPELRPLAKALAKYGAGAAVLRWSLPQAKSEHQRHVLVEEITNAAGRWVGGDLKDAFDPRRGEGYYRIDGGRERFYKGMVFEG